MTRESSHGLNTAGVTAFPACIAMASTWDEDLNYRVGRAIAREAQLVIGGVDLRQDAFAVFEVHRALGRYRHLARGAVEEAGAEMFFELRHVAARHGAGQVEGVCGAHERAQFRHPGENPHALQLVHGRRFYRGLSSRDRQ